MAKESPESFRDPYWSDLATKSATKYGIPAPLLVSVLTNGERSNKNQVSEAGAKTVFQVTPTTRDLILRRDGIDAYLSDENAADAAALVLKDGVNWAKSRAKDPGDAERLAAGYYHGGGDTANWGARTESYMNRVMVGQSSAKKDALSEGFAQFMASNPAVPAGRPAAAPSAPAQAPAEDKLASGFGQWLDSQKPKPGPEAIPVEPGANITPTGAPPPTTLGQDIVGAGEAALSTATGLTGGALGMAGGAAKGIAGSILDGSFGTPEALRAVEQAAAEGAGALTYAPRTQAGQQQTEAVGQAMQAAIPVMPLTAELGAAAAGARAAAPAVMATGRAGADVAQTAAMQAGQAVRNAPGRVAEIAGFREPAAAAIGSARGRAAGTASVPQNMIRSTKAEGLEVPITLTKGAETRDAAQLAFEKEQMKGPLGAPLRARAEENNLQALQNFDSLIDKTTAEAPDISATGNKVVGALAQGYKEAKNRTNVAYRKANNSAEALKEVDQTKPVTIGEGAAEMTSTPLDYLNSKVTGVKSAALTDAAKQYAVKLGVAEMDDAGKLIPKPTDVKTLEAWRKEISQATGFEHSEVRDSTILKKLIDAQTEPLAGPLYKEARTLRTQQARKFENRAVVARLITNRRGMDDPTVAVDQVFQKSIMNGSPEEITFLKRVLNTSGKDGQQAWRELQGATLRHIKDEATKGMGMDSADNPIISPAKLHQTVQALDKNGRLDLVLGKKQAETVRDLNDVVRYVSTVPPGTLINNSGTAGALLAAMAEAGTTGALTGLPVPVLSILRALSQRLTDKRMQAKIKQALNNKPKPASF